MKAFRIVKRVIDPKEGYRNLKAYTIFEGSEEECIEKRKEYKSSTHTFYFIEEK